MKWDFALLFLFLAVVVPWRGAVQIRRLLSRPQTSTRERILVYSSTIALQWIMAAVVLWRCLARAVDFDSLALALPQAGLTIDVAIALSFILVAHQLISLRRLARLPIERQGFLGQIARRLLPQKITETLAFIALAATAALCEEFLYRGFVFAALQRIPGRSILFAVFVSSLLFALAHIYQGPRGVFATFIIGLLFAVARAWTGSLLAPVIAHLVTDLAAGLAAPRMLAAADQAANASATNDPVENAAQTGFDEENSATK